MSCNDQGACMGNTHERLDETRITDDVIDTCINAWSNGMRPVINQLMAVCYDHDGTIADIVEVLDIDEVFETTRSCREYIVTVCPHQAWGEVPMSQATISHIMHTESGRSAWCDSVTSVRVVCDATYHMQPTTTPVVSVDASVDLTMYTDGGMELNQQPVISVREQQ